MATKLGLGYLLFGYDDSGDALANMAFVGGMTALERVGMANDRFRLTFDLMDRVNSGPTNAVSHVRKQAAAAKARGLDFNSRRAYNRATERIGYLKEARRNRGLKMISEARNLTDHELLRTGYRENIFQRTLTAIQQKTGQKFSVAGFIGQEYDSAYGMVRRRVATKPGMRPPSKPLGVSSVSYAMRMGPGNVMIQFRKDVAASRGILGMGAGIQQNITRNVAAQTVTRIARERGVTSAINLHKIVREVDTSLTGTIKQFIMNKTGGNGILIPQGSLLRKAGAGLARGFTAGAAGAATLGFFAAPVVREAFHSFNRGMAKLEQASYLDFGSGSVPLSGAAMNERNRALQAMANSNMNARNGLGNEAALMHGR